MKSEIRLCCQPTSTFCLGFIVVSTAHLCVYFQSSFLLLYVSFQYKVWIFTVKIIFRWKTWVLSFAILKEFSLYSELFEMEHLLFLASFSSTYYKIPVSNTSVGFLQRRGCYGLIYRQSLLSAKLHMKQILLFLDQNILNSVLAYILVRKKEIDCSLIKIIKVILWNNLL